MKAKVYLTLCLLSTFVGYMEWGNDQHSFLIQTEWEIIQKALENPLSIIHPMILLPVFGQLLLLLSIFQKQPKKWMVYTGIGLLSILLLFILFIGISQGSLNMFLSALPFPIFSILSIRSIKKAS